MCAHCAALLGCWPHFLPFIRAHICVNRGFSFFRHVARSVLFDSLTPYFSTGLSTLKIRYPKMYGNSILGFFPFNNSVMFVNVLHQVLSRYFPFPYFVPSFLIWNLTRISVLVKSFFLFVLLFKLWTGARVFFLITDISQTTLVARAFRTNHRSFSVIFYASQQLFLNFLPIIVCSSGQIIARKLG